MLWIILIPFMMLAAFFAAKYLRVMNDYGSSYFFWLALLFLFFGGLSGFVVWMFGWFFLWVSMYRKIELGVT